MKDSIEYIFDDLRYEKCRCGKIVMMKFADPHLLFTVTIEDLPAIHAYDLPLRQEVCFFQSVFPSFASSTHYSVSLCRYHLVGMELKDSAGITSLVNVNMNNSALPPEFRQLSPHGALPTPISREIVSQWEGKTLHRALYVLAN